MVHRINVQLIRVFSWWIILYLVRHNPSSKWINPTYPTFYEDINYYISGMIHQVLVYGWYIYLILFSWWMFLDVLPNPQPPSQSTHLLKTTTIALRSLTETSDMSEHAKVTPVEIVIEISCVFSFSIDWFKGTIIYRKIPWSLWESRIGFRFRFSLFCQPIDIQNGDAQ